HGPHRRIDRQDAPRPSQRVEERLWLRNRAADDRFDDLRELGGMRRSQENSVPSVLTVPPFLLFPPALPCVSNQSKIRNRAVRIEPVSTTGVDLSNRRAHFVVVVTTAGDIAAHRVEIATVQPHEAISTRCA